MKKMNGSMTIEAAVLLPLFLVLFFAAIQTGIFMYEEIAVCAAKIMKEDDLDTVADFYRRVMLEGIIGDGD